MKSETSLIPGWVSNVALVTVSAIAVILPAIFYYSTNRGEVVDPDSFNFDTSELLAHVDLCQVTDDHILIQGWAFLIGENLNSPTQVYIENDRGAWLSVNSRVIPRPDVNENFDIHYHNSALGFTASTGILSEEVTQPTRVVLTKQSTSGHLHGAEYACQG